MCNDAIPHPQTTRKSYRKNFPVQKDFDHVLNELERVYNRYAQSGSLLDERVFAGIIKMSDHQLKKINEAITMTNSDWRDVLMCAGFGEDLNAHKEWLAQECRK